MLQAFDYLSYLYKYRGLKKHSNKRKMHMSSQFSPLFQCPAGCSRTFNSTQALSSHCRMTGYKYSVPVSPGRVFVTDQDLERVRLNVSD
ncbi:hypothetical protein BYT27DRAFT_6379351 [Phlegmacium glaucopus]|nr:hypothetical protein BYT27DRAFT_6379351 [Phlegmacium glaucopus]